jgi:hypothetical protein
VVIQTHLSSLKTNRKGARGASGLPTTADYDTLDYPEDMDDAAVLNRFVWTESLPMTVGRLHRDNHGGAYTGRSLPMAR